LLVAAGKFKLRGKLLARRDIDGLESDIAGLDDELFEDLG
jgi:hypothetical protein